MDWDGIIIDQKTKRDREAAKTAVNTPHDDDDFKKVEDEEKIEPAIMEQNKTKVSNLTSKRLTRTDKLVEEPAILTRTNQVLKEKASDGSISSVKRGLRII